MKINLDDVAPQDTEVVLNGTTYLVPADLPVEDYIDIVTAAEAYDEATVENGLHRTRELYERLLALFRVRQPELERLPIGTGQMVLLVVALYGGGEPTEEAEADPTPGEAGTTPASPTKKPRPRKKSTS